MVVSSTKFYVKGRYYQKKCYACSLTGGGKIFGQKNVTPLIPLGQCVFLFGQFGQTGFVEKPLFGHSFYFSHGYTFFVKNPVVCRKSPLSKTSKFG